MRVVLITFLLAIMVSLGCESDQCTDGDTRCFADYVEVCADGAWRLDDNCNVVTMFDFTVENWRCCKREMAVCLPECEGGI